MLHGGPQPHRITPPRRVAPCAARRCVAALGVPLRGATSQLVSSSCTVAHNRLATPPRSVACCAARRCVAALDLPAACKASRLVQLRAAQRPTAASRHSTSERRVRHPAAWIAWRLVQLKAARRPTAASCHSTSERRVLRSSPLRRGPYPSRCVKSVAPGSAQSCTSAHSRLASLHLGASRVAHRCVAALGRPAACIASRLVQLKAVGGPQPPRVTPPRSVACCAARRSRPATLHLGGRVLRSAAASRPLADPLRA